MNILFAHGKFTLLSSNGSNKVFARQFLRRSFINNLYTSPISSIIDSYGDFVVVGYYTGGRAFAQYMGNAGSNTNVEQKTKSLEKILMLHLYIKVTHLMDRSDLMERMVLLILQCTKDKIYLYV